MTRRGLQTATLAKGGINHTALSTTATYGHTLYVLHTVQQQIELGLTLYQT